MSLLKLTGLITLLTWSCLAVNAWASVVADAGCEEKLAALDAQLDEGVEMGEAQEAAFRDMRDTAAEFCHNGNDQMASTLLDGLLQQAGVETTDETQKQTVQAEATNETVSDEYALGTPRDDLERFFGLYQVPDQPNRQLFAAPADSGNLDRPIPQGYMMIGAMWGDAQNWFMKSTSDTRFEQQWASPASEPVIAEFITDSEGRAVALSLQSPYMNYDRMDRVGDLPEAWQ